jgi:ABC-type branched-subunit amino acid transport system substrate-binding protein
MWRHSIRGLSVALGLALGAPHPSAAEPATTYVLAAVYQQSETGRRFRDGIQDAIDAFSAGTSARPELAVALKDFPYVNATDGLEHLTEAVEDPEVHAVIGPTESGIFLRAIDRRTALEKFKVPVISSMVTADIEYTDGSWFFRTNVNVDRRAGAIYDFVNKYWIQSIALLYADTEFGLRSEIAFADSLSRRQRSLYMPLLFSSSARARSQVAKVLQAKPEAVGIFGKRSDIADIYSSLRQMDAGGEPYRPILFTLIDARFAGESLADLYFVSVAPPDIEESYDDVKALAYDTTLLVLDELGKADPEASHEEQKVFLRDGLEAALRWGANLEGTKTDFDLANHENITQARVFLLKEGARVEKSPVQVPVGWRPRLERKVALARDRFGFWPFFNLAMIMIIVVVWSVSDIKKWYSGRWRRLFLPRNYPFYALVLLNMVIVGLLYVGMAEMGSISYGSTLAAVTVAVAPLAALRINLFETPAGRQVGIGRFYEMFLQWVNDRLMFFEHRETKSVIHLIAYHNSVDGMKSYLKELYRHQRNVAQRIRLETELAEKVNDTLPYLERRKVCARLLLRTAGWHELQEDGLAPPGDLRELGDPEALIRAAARHCAGDAIAKQQLGQAIKEEIDAIEDESRRRELEAALLRDLQGVVGEQGRLRRRLAFLFVLRGWDESYLRQNFLPAKEPDEPAAGQAP